MIINILLLISLFILPDSLACFSFLFLVLRGVHWLFGPAQDMMDDYYYERLVNAQERYEKKRHDANMKALMERRKSRRKI